jgi:hypothetical protein
MLACTPIRGRHSRAVLMGRVANPGKGRDWIYAMIDDSGTIEVADIELEVVSHERLLGAYLVPTWCLQ